MTSVEDVGRLRMVIACFGCASGVGPWLGVDVLQMPENRLESIPSV